MGFKWIDLEVTADAELEKMKFEPFIINTGTTPIF